MYSTGVTCKLNWNAGELGSNNCSVPRNIRFSRFTLGRLLRLGSWLAIGAGVSSCSTDRGPHSMQRVLRKQKPWIGSSTSHSRKGQGGHCVQPSFALGFNMNGGRITLGMVLIMSPRFLTCSTSAMLPPYWVGESRVSTVTAFGIQTLPDACNPVNKVDVSVDTGNGLYFGMRPCRLLDCLKTWHSITTFSAAKPCGVYVVCILSRHLKCNGKICISLQPLMQQ